MIESESLPLVSIIIPTYNRANLIGETLLSVKNQTYQNWECIVVDDGSSDNTEQVVNNIIESEKRISFYKRNRKPKGAPTCRNIGFDQSKGEYIVFLDSDDLMTDFCLGRRVDLFKKHPAADFLVFPSVLFNEDKADSNYYWNIDSPQNDLERFLRIDAIWPICGPFYKRIVISKLDGFREGLGFWQDYDLHLRVLLVKFSYEKFLNLPPDIFIRRHNKTSISQSIPLISDVAVLQNRIDFFLFFVSFINDNNIKLTSAQSHTLWSILAYFSSSFLIIHNDRKQYLKYWRKTKKALHIYWLKHLLSSVFIYLNYWRKVSIYFIKMGNIYKLIFGSLVADIDLIKKSTVSVVKYKGNEKLFNKNIVTTA